MAGKKDSDMKLEEGAGATEREETAGPETEERCILRLPKGRSDIEKQDLFVGVNGKSYLIKRGEEVEVPKSVIEVLKNAEKQNESAMDYMEKVRNQEIIQE